MGESVRPVSRAMNDAAAEAPQPLRLWWLVILIGGVCGWALVVWAAIGILGLLP